MLNKINLMGRMVKDPEIRTTQSGVSNCTFTIAVDRKFQKQGEDKKTDFISCVAWKQNAEFVSKYFTKGKLIIVCGSLQTRTWEGTDGKKNYVTEVIVDEVGFGGDGKQEGNSAASSNYKPVQQAQVADDESEDLPF